MHIVYRRLLAAIIAYIFLSSYYPGHKLAGPAVPKEVDEDFHLYLLVGQSNMAGRAKLDSLSKMTNPSILAFDKTGNWVHATDPIHFDKPSAGVGPGISFAQTVLWVSGANNIKIGLIPCSVGGTSIDLWFEGKYDPVTKTYPYDDAIRRTKAAMKYGVLKGILWHQGGSDNTPVKAVGYLEKQMKVISNFRRDLGVGTIPFIMGEQGYFKEVRIINDIIKEVPSLIPNVAIVSAEGLTHIGDSLHFDTRSARLLGVRYADKMLCFDH